MPTYNVSLAGVFYNKEIFDKYDLEVPKTVSELEAVCDKLKEEGITPFALANGPKWTGSMYFQCLAARKGGLEPFQSAVSGEGTFEDECFIYAGEKIQEWVEKGYFPEGVNSSMRRSDGSLSRQWTDLTRIHRFRSEPSATSSFPSTVREKSLKRLLNARLTILPTAQKRRW